MIKVAFDCQIFNLQKFGGISRYYSVLSEQFQYMSIQSRIFAGCHQNHYVSSLDSSLIQGVRVDKYPRYTAKSIINLNRLVTKPLISSWSPDLIHETYYSKKTFGPNGIPRVITVYDMIHELYPDSYGANDKTSESKKIAIKRAEHIICISESAKKDLIDLLSIPESKITVVHLGVDNKLSSYASEQPHSHRPFVLYVGSRSGYKNFPNFIKSFASNRLLMSEFDIMAFGGGAFSGDELLVIKKLGFGKNQVQQVGGSDEVLAQLYKSATAFVFPSMYEGFGLPPLEAMTCDCPVIASNTSSIPEVVGDAGLFFDPSDLESMSSAMETVCFSESERNRLVRLGHRRAESFNWNKCASRTLKVYEKTVKSV